MKDITTIIGILANQSNDYSYSVTSAILNAAEKYQDVRIVCFYYELNVYDLNIDNFIKKNSLDGVIVISGSVLQSVFKDTVNVFFEKIGIPVISIGKRMEGHTAILIDNRKSVKDAVVKLIKLDKTRDLIMIKGPDSSSEAQERYNGFMDAIKSEKINENKINIFEGNFNSESVEHVFPQIEKIIKSGKKVSVFACNDEMAIRFYKKCIESNISIPKQAFILGFDGLQRSLEYSISTIEQPFDVIGRISLESILKMVRSEKVIDITLPLSLTERISTGNYACKNEEEKEFINNEDFRQNYISIERSFFNPLNDYIEDKNLDMSVLWVKFTEKLLCIGIKECYLFLQNKNSFIDVLDINEIGQTSGVMVVGYNPEKNYITEGDVKTLKEYSFLHNNEIVAGKKRNFLVYPLFSSKHNYGSIVFGVNNKFDYCFYELIIARLVSFFKTLISTMQKNKEIVLKEKEADNNLRDSLTGFVMNTWLDSNKQKIIINARENNLILHIFFFDVDGLKKINDTYGHDEGDIVLEYVSRILSGVFRNTDRIVRKGGDEFVVISCVPLINQNYKADISTRLFNEREKINKKIDKPYKVSFSMGMSSCLNPLSLDRDEFDKMITRADEEMYKDKNSKK